MLKSRGQSAKKYRIQDLLCAHVAYNCNWIRSCQVGHPQLVHFLWLEFKRRLRHFRHFTRTHYNYLLYVTGYFASYRYVALFLATNLSEKGLVPPRSCVTRTLCSYFCFCRSLVAHILFWSVWRLAWRNFALHFRTIHSWTNILVINKHGHTRAYWYATWSRCFNYWFN